MTLLVGDELTILFLHIPKCGGSSIVELFKNNGFSAQLEMRGLGPQSCLRASPQHLTYEELKTIIRPENLSDIFTVTRNPYRRMLSEYNWNFRDVSKHDKPDINGWVINSIEETTKNPNYADNHFRPMIDFIDPTIPCKIFKLENSISLIAELFIRQEGEFEPIKIPRRQNSKTFSDSVKEFKFNDRAEAMINSFYRHDFHAFDYKMEIMGNPVDSRDIVRMDSESSETKDKIKTIIKLRRATDKLIKTKIESELKALAAMTRGRIKSVGDYLEEKKLERSKESHISDKAYDDILLYLNHMLHDIQNLATMQEDKYSYNQYKKELEIIRKYRSSLSINQIEQKGHASC